MATLANSSTSILFRKPQTNDAVLVTAPHISNESTSKHNDAACLVVESESYQDVNVSSSIPESTSNTNNSNNTGSNNPLRRFLETSVGTILSQKSAALPVVADKEMDEFIKSNDAPIQIVSPAIKRNVIDSFDICREYGYSGDDGDGDDDQELNNRYFNSGPPLTADFVLPDGSNVETFVLGKTYHPMHDYISRRTDESSLFWFTYRCDFPCLDPYGITSDAGWGCMLRALQMMCAQTLRLHYKSREWRPPSSAQQRRQDPFIRSILTWFADFPSTNVSIYSLHNMVAAGLAKYDKLPGEWYGPGTACYVLRDLVEMHETNQKRSDQSYRQMFRVHVASGGTVFRDAIEERMTTDVKARLEDEKKKRWNECPSPSHPLAVVAWEEELLDPLSNASSSNAPNDGLTTARGEWDTALLLLIPLRLGLKNFNADYVKAVAHTFSLPQSVGVLGGRPRGARWFYGALSDGSKIFGLDPHTVQSAPKRRLARVNGNLSSVMELSDEYIQSVHTTFPEVFNLKRMDPSIALGFYCRNRTDFEMVFSSIEQWRQSHAGSPEIFTVADRTPNYSAGASNVALDEMTDSILDDVVEENPNDDDEFIML